MTTPIETLPDFINAAQAFEARTATKPVAAVLPACNRFSLGAPQSLMGLAIAFDPGLTATQALFFANPQEFTRYTSKIPAK